MIKTHNLGLRIGQKDILKDVNIEMLSGQMTAILGSNGAGKSTLIKCLTGLETPSYGQVMLDDKPLDHYSLLALSQKRAVFSQSQVINFPFTAIEIVAMGRSPYLSKNNAQEDQSIIQEVMHKTDVWHLKDRLITTLSGGEQQRVHLARVLSQIWHQRKACVFLDEPTSALDLKHQHQMLQIAQDLSYHKHVTMCVVMHDIYLARHWANNIILMKEGAIFAQGLTEDVLSSQNLAYVFDVSETFFSSF